MILHKFYIDFLIEHNITQPQYLLLHLLYKKDFKAIEEYKKKFPVDDGSGTMIGRYLTDDLIKKHWLIKKGDKYEITDRFKDVYVQGEVALDELIQEYPPFIEKEDGVKIPLVTVDRYVYGLRYSTAIYSSYKEHKQILKDLKFAVKEKLISFGIEKFIDSEYWKVIRKLRLDPANNSKEAIIKEFYDDF